jgi:hypothetical protein
MAKGKAFLDLWEANKTVLLEAGLQEDNIEIMGFARISTTIFSFRLAATDPIRSHGSGIRLV